MADLGFLEWIKLAIFYASFLYFPVAAIVAWAAMRSAGARRIALAAFFICISLLAYGRFVEPRILLTAEHDVVLDGCFSDAGELRVAVFADMHLGLFGNTMEMSRIIRRVNEADADLIFVPGDFTYYLDPDLFEGAFAGLRDLTAPTYAVLGNHDLGFPGPDLSAPLKATLPSTGISLIDDKVSHVSGDGFAIELVGISDLWARNQNLSLLQAPATRPRIVLTHNPETVSEFDPSMKSDLLIAGHTHGGQISLPGFTCVVTGVCGDAGYGLHKRRGTAVFITSGTGMVMLPMRFRVPPRIDVLNIRYEACDTPFRNVAN